jgi:NAD(P)-dependent dehydrogenase (short-subunit alcohol dehydrogenase family)
MHDLQGRIALLTGSSRGIGTAVAKLFATHGAFVMVFSPLRARPISFW